MACSALNPKNDKEVLSGIERVLRVELIMLTTSDHLLSGTQYLGTCGMGEGVAPPHCVCVIVGAYSPNTDAALISSLMCCSNAAATAHSI